MRTPKQTIRDWLGITKLEDIVSTLQAEAEIEALLELADEPTIKKGYDASL